MIPYSSDYFSKDLLHLYPHVELQLNEEEPLVNCLRNLDLLL